MDSDRPNAAESGRGDPPTHPGAGDTRTVHALGPDMSGRWLVTTQGSTHVWDLDAMTYQRHPGPRSRSGAFAHDGVAHRITRVTLWPVVGGRSFVWFDDPDEPTLLEHYRISSTIVEIRRLS